jgi:hypothetical protein
MYQDDLTQYQGSKEHSATSDECMHKCIAFLSQATTHAVHTCQSSFLAEDLGHQHNLSLAMLAHPWLDPDHPCQ